MKLLRRDVLRYLSLSAATWTLAPLHGWADLSSNFITKKIPSSGVQIPAIGMGTWITFNVGGSQKLRNDRTEVLKEFFAHGGGMIDSSPMYGSSEEVLGYALSKLGHPKSLFSATKVWTSDTDEGKEQIQASKTLWKLKKLDLLQVHNLLNWEEHLKTLRQLKEAGEVRYIGITTSHGRRHSEFEKIMRSTPLDFVQLTYNIVDREAEKRLLGVAQERGIAVIANRPYRGGDLIERLQRKPYPAWATDAGMKNWPEFLLKYIVSHPAVTCAIPATSQVAHMRENMGACTGPLPGEALRVKMAKHVAAL